MKLEAFAAAVARLHTATQTALEAQRKGASIEALAPLVTEVRLALAEARVDPSEGARDPKRKDIITRAKDIRWREVQALAKAAWKACDPIVIDMESGRQNAEPRAAYVAQVLQHVADLRVALLMAQAVEAVVDPKDETPPPA